MSLVLDTFNQLMGSDADTSSKIFRVITCGFPDDFGVDSI